MDALARSPASPLLFALVLRAAGVGTVEGVSKQQLTHCVGESATFSLDVRQSSTISNLLWRTSSRGSMEAVAMWKQGNPLDVLSVSYSRRVTFREQSQSLEISNLSKADGGFYEAMLQEPNETLLEEYTLFVFDIGITAGKSANGSCSLHLSCEAGAGAETQVQYTWRPTQSQAPGTPGATLHLVLHPADKHKSYTCEATAFGSHHSVAVIPYKSCNSGTRAAGLLTPGWLAGSAVNAALGPALLALLMVL